MQIRPVDVDDDAEFARFHEVMDRAERHERPLAGMWSLTEAKVLFSEGDPAEDVWGVVAVDDGEVVAAGMASLPRLDNHQFAWVMPWVEPHRRGRGLGSAVLEHLLDRCRDEGRTHHIIETAYPFARREDHPYRKFAERHGFSLANTEVRRHLPLPVDDTELDHLAAESAAHHEGYRLLSFAGPIRTSWSTPCAPPRTCSPSRRRPAPSTSRRSASTVTSCASARRSSSARGAP